MEKFTPLQYLKIDIANSFGLDREDWKVRLDWFDQNKDQLVQLADKADNICQYKAGVIAYYKYLNHEPTGYMVGLDSTSSVLQWLAVLTGDIDTGKLCNVVNTGHREDAYSIITKEMQPYLGNVEIPRKLIKKAVMTNGYCSEKIPKEVFGDHVEDFKKLMEKITPYAYGLKEYLRNHWDSSATNYSWTMPDGFQVSCDIVDTVTTEVTFMGETRQISHKEIKAKEEGRILPPNLVHSVDALCARELCTRCMLPTEQKENLNKLFYSSLPNSIGQIEKTYNLRMVNKLLKLAKKSGFISTRIFDYLDENTIKLVIVKGMYEDIKKVFSTIPQNTFYLECIHDCFLCHANNMQTVREQIKEVMYSIANGNMLHFLLTQMLPKEASRGELEFCRDMGKRIAPYIKDAEYIIS